MTNLKVEYLKQDIANTLYKDLLFKVYIDDNPSVIMTIDEAQFKFYNELEPSQMSVDNVNLKIYIRTK